MENEKDAAFDAWLSSQTLPADYQTVAQLAWSAALRAAPPAPVSRAEPVAWSANWIRDRIADQVEMWPNRDWSNRIIANQIRRIEIAAPAPTDEREAFEKHFYGWDHTQQKAKLGNHQVYKNETLEGMWQAWQVRAQSAPLTNEGGKGEGVAWLIECEGNGKRMSYATVDENDTNHWPLDQWRLITKTPLYAAPAPTASPAALKGNQSDEFFARASAKNIGPLSPSALLAASPATAPQPSAKALTDDWRDQLATLIDIYDDGINNPPESRCYVDGAFKQQMDEARALLADHSRDVTKLAAEQPSEDKRDSEMLDYLQEQVVDTIYLDDGRIIDVGGKPHSGNLRAAVRAAIAKGEGV